MRHDPQARDAGCHASATASVASRASRARRRYPSGPIRCVTAHAAASGPPDRVDCIVLLSIG